MLSLFDRGSFLRPDLRSMRRQVQPSSRLARIQSGPPRSGLDGGEHGATMNFARAAKDSCWVKFLTLTEIASLRSQ